MVSCYYSTFFHFTISHLLEWTKTRALMNVLLRMWSNMSSHSFKNLIKIYLLHFPPFLLLTTLVSPPFNPCQIDGLFSLWLLLWCIFATVCMHTYKYILLSQSVHCYFWIHYFRGDLLLLNKQLGAPFPGESNSPSLRNHS